MNEKSDSERVSALPGTADNALPKKPVKETGSKSKAELRAERRALQVSKKC